MEQYIDLRLLYLSLVLVSALFITFAIGTVKSIDLFAAAIFAAKWPSVVVIFFAASLLFVIISIVGMIMHESGAIENGISLQKLFDLVASLRSNHQQLPTAIGVFLFLSIPFLWDIFGSEDRLLDTI